MGSMGGGGVSGFGGVSGGGGGSGGAIGGGDPLHSNQFLILGQQSAQRGMDRVVGGGNGGAVGVVTGDKGGTPGIKRSGVGGVDGDELGIDWCLQVAKGVEEGHKAFEERERIDLEKRNRRLEAKELKMKMRKQRSGASPTRMLRQNSIGRVVGTTGAMGVMVGLANPGLLSVSVLKKAGEPKSAEIIHDSATKKSPVAGQPPSPGLLVPTVQLTASASNRSLLSPNRMSPIPSSGDEESGLEERASPQRSNTNTSNAPQGQKILQGFKNLGRNVKRFANLGGGNNSGGANSLSKTSRDILDTSPPEEPLNTRASTSGARLPRVSDASMRDPLAVKTRSFSVGDLTTPPVSAIASALPDHDTSSSPNSSVNAEDESGKPKISIEPFLDNSIATVPPFLRRSRSESQLHSQQSHSSLAPSSRQSHSRQSLVSENGTSGGGGFGAGKPSDGSLRSSRRSNTKNVKRSVTKRKLHVAAASSLRGTKSKVNLSPVDAAGIGAGNISDGVVDASDIEVLPSKETIERLQQKRRILETSTDIPELIEAITERLATLRNHPKINSQVSNPLNADTSQASASDSATAMSGSRITPILQSIDATYSQLAILKSQSIPTTTTLPLEEQSIHQVQEHLSSLTERIQSAIQTRSEHKTKLLSELKTLVHTQKETVGQIDALNTQTMKLKYAVGLLEGRVMETEEAARVFVSRVQNVETRLKDGWGGGATEGGIGWFGWIFGRRG
ncbi:hypothetical protein BDR26DRAFT_855267 [Obelidium mucronatum]|nr:hypothetical protein BDR26DRAFT_855267 [Obelidium mucronatum]